MILVPHILLIPLLVTIFHSDDLILAHFVFGPVLVDHLPFCHRIFFVHSVHSLLFTNSWKTGVYIFAIMFVFIKRLFTSSVGLGKLYLIGVARRHSMAKSGSLPGYFA